MATQKELCDLLVAELDAEFVTTRMNHVLELLDAETRGEHVLMLNEDGYSLAHPLRERLPSAPGETEPELDHCDVGAWVEEYGQLIVRGDMGDWQVGRRYRVWMDTSTTLAGEPL